MPELGGQKFMYIDWANNEEDSTKWPQFQQTGQFQMHDTYFDEKFFMFHLRRPWLECPPAAQRRKGSFLRPGMMQK